MAVGRKIIAVLTGAVVIAITADADLMPMSVADAVCVPPVTAACPPDLQNTSLSAPFGYPDPANLNSLTVIFPAEVGPPADALHATPLIRTDEQDSLGLCLCALVGLGLCRSAPYVRKFSFGTIPEWYHTGGPFQVGHSHAISPDRLCSVPVYCFVQADRATEGPTTQYRHETIVCFWRTSQFTSDVIASRGPPSDARESVSG
jgi:hypothetical protein